MSSTTDLLEVAGLACGYRPGQPVLAGIDLTVQRGSTVALIGPSGCGKSTLLKSLLGLVPPLAGEVRFSSADGQGLEGRIGYVPQRLGLVEHTTVLRNVLAGTLPEVGRLRSLLGTFSHEHERRAREALERVGLGDRAAARPAHLSGGERRRVAIARALAQRPALLLADELLSELDEGTAATILDVLRALQHEAGTAVLMVEHDLERSCAVADTLCCLGAGTLLATLAAAPDRPRRAREVMARAARPAA